MPTRTRVVIGVICVIAAACTLGPAVCNLVRIGSRPQVVITIPAAAMQSPLPYSTPSLAATTPAAPTSAGSASRSAGAASAAPVFDPAAGFGGAQPAIVKLRKPGDGTVDINSASVSDLERLPGIGPAMAARIVQERDALGRFRKPTDLFEVRGIGPKKYAKMAPFVVTR